MRLGPSPPAQLCTARFTRYFLVQSESRSIFTQSSTSCGILYPHSYATIDCWLTSVVIDLAVALAHLTLHVLEYRSRYSTVPRSSVAGVAYQITDHGSGRPSVTPIDRHAMEVCTVQCTVLHPSFDNNDILSASRNPQTKMQRAVSQSTSFCSRRRTVTFVLS